MTFALEIVELLLNRPARFFASALPVLIAVMLVIAANMPVSFTGGALPAPALALTAVYFWALVRPDLMSPFSVLLIGLLEDLLSGGPPGLWAAGFLAAYAFADRQRDALAGLSGPGTLVGFTGAMVLAGVTAYGLASVVYLRWAPLPPLLLESVSTVLFYALTALPMQWVYVNIVGPMRGGD